MRATHERRVLVTGASGALGHAVTRSLRHGGWQVRGFDVNPAKQPGEHVVGDLLDIDRLYQATEGVDVVVHLAAVPDRDNFNQELVPNNIMGTHNVFEWRVCDGFGESSMRAAAGW